MNFCSNCGEKADDNATFCGKCGAVINNVPMAAPRGGDVVYYSQTQQSNGGGVASMILGIFALVVGFITFFIAIGVAVAISDSYRYCYYSCDHVGESMIAAIFVVFLPLLLSIIGFCLSFTGRDHRTGYNTAGLVLNLIALIGCVIQVIIIMAA